MSTSPKHMRKSKPNRLQRSLLGLMAGVAIVSLSFGVTVKYLGPPVEQYMTVPPDRQEGATP